MGRRKTHGVDVGGVAGAARKSLHVEISGSGQDFDGPSHVSGEFALLANPFGAHFFPL